MQIRSVKKLNYFWIIDLTEFHRDYLRFTERANVKRITLNANIEMTKKKQIKNASAKIFEKLHLLKLAYKTFTVII